MRYVPFTTITVAVGAMGTKHLGRQDTAGGEAARGAAYVHNLRLYSAIRRRNAEPAMSSSVVHLQQRSRGQFKQAKTPR